MNGDCLGYFINNVYEIKTTVDIIGNFRKN